MQFELKQMNGKMVQIYPESFKRKVIEEYLSGHVCKMDLLRKYGIKTKSGIQRWMKSYGYKDPHRSRNFTFTPTISFALIKKTDAKNLSQEDLQNKIRELERQLEDEKLRSEAYVRIIEKAEKELRIPIRKKPNTK